MTENIEIPDSPEALVEEAEREKYRPLFRTFLEIFEGGEKTRNDKIGTAWATRVVGMYAEMTFSKVAEFRDRYFDKIEEAGMVVADTFLGHPVADQVYSKEEDLEVNRERYLNLVLGWQMLVLFWELSWDVSSPDAAVELAAIGEVRSMLLGENGIAQYFQSIDLELTEGETEAVVEALKELEASELAKAVQ